MDKAKTVVIVAPGKLLSNAEVVAIRRSGVDVIAIADNYKLFPEAKIIYASDGEWWNAHPDVLKHTGRRVSVGVSGIVDTEILEHVSDESWWYKRTRVTGSSSGQHAICKAVHEGYTRIILVGYEYGAAGDGHWFGAHAAGVHAVSDWAGMAADMRRFADRLVEHRIDVVNATQPSNLFCFKSSTLDEALKEYQKSGSNDAPPVKSKKLS